MEAVMKDVWKQRYTQGQQLRELYAGYSYAMALRAADVEHPELVEPLWDDMEHWSEESAFVREQFYKAGFYGDEPRYVEAIRFGRIPENGRSMNHAEGKYEQGVSVVAILEDGAKETDQSIYDVIKGAFGFGSKKYVIAGWFLGRRGSDGEPLLVGAKLIREA